MNHRSQASWRARQGRVVVLILGLTVVTPSLLGWAQDIRPASPGHSASEEASAFVFKSWP